MSARPDVVVIGGGIVGGLASLALAERGMDVILLEKGTIASGASGGPGMRGVRSAGRDVRELPLAAASTRLWSELAARSGLPLVDRIGGLTVSNTPLDGRAGGPNAAAQVLALRAFGIDARVLDRDDLLAREPELSGEAAGGILVADDGVIAHELATRAAAERARALGVRIRERVAVAAIREDGAVVLHTGEVLEPARAVLAAANTAVRHLVRPLIGDLPLWAAAPQMNFVRPAGGFAPRGLVNHSNRPVAIKAVADGTVMISGGSRGEWNDRLETGTAIRDVATRALAQAAAVFGALDGATVESIDASRGDSWSVDGVAVIDVIPTAVPVYYATGWSGHGFATAPATARALVDWILSRQRPAVLAPFSSARFGPRQ